MKSNPARTKTKASASAITAANYSDYIVAMKEGAVHCDGNVSDVITEQRLSELYGLTFDIAHSERGYLCNYFKPLGNLE